MSYPCHPIVLLQVLLYNKGFATCIWHIVNWVNLPHLVCLIYSVSFWKQIYCMYKNTTAARVGQQIDHYRHNRQPNEVGTYYLSKTFELKISYLHYVLCTNVLLLKLAYVIRTNKVFVFIWFRTLIQIVLKIINSLIRMWYELLI